MESNEVKTLKDLNSLRSAPLLTGLQSIELHKELRIYTENSDWFTIGIMANSSSEAILNLKEIEKYYQLDELKIVSDNDKSGPVFLKGNQNSGMAYIRQEFGLGEGILISCHYNNDLSLTNTFGPFPLNFFRTD